MRENPLSLYMIHCCDPIDFGFVFSFLTPGLLRVCVSQGRRANMEKEGVVMNGGMMKRPAFDVEESLVFLSGRTETHVDGGGQVLRNHISVGGKHLNDVNCSMVDLKLGRLGDFGDGFSNLRVPPLRPPPPPSVSVSSPAATRRSRSSNNGNQVAACIVDDCSADLSGCKDYHKKHKVCEAHSKAVRVTVEGVEKRFCQQCSKFHALSEFDEVKRSCRKRLDGHNKRRRKSHPDMSSGVSIANIQGVQSYLNQNNFQNAIREHNWTSEFIKSEHGSVYDQPPPMLPMNRQQPFLGPYYYKGFKQFPFLQGSDMKPGRKPMQTSMCQPPLCSAVATQGSSSRYFSDGLIRVIDFDCALSLLSSSPHSSGLSLSMDRIPMALPLVPSMEFNGVDRFPDVGCGSTDGGSGNDFSCSGIVDDQVGSIIVANSGHAEFHSQGMLQHGSNVANPSNGVQSLHLPWE